jgi:hypothetical protein
MRNNKNLIAKVILFIILFLGVIFELANHFHLTYIFVNSKLGTLIPEKWVLIISFLGAMFFVCSIVGLGIIGYKAGSWGMALLTVGVSYMSYALIPASINTDVMQIATLEYAVVLPLIVAFTTHELSKFLGLKEITTLTQEQEILLENIKRTQEFEKRKNQLSLNPTPPVQQVTQSVPVQTQSVPKVTQSVPPVAEPPESFYSKLINDAINKPLNGTHYPTNIIRSSYKEKSNAIRSRLTQSVPRNDIGFKFITHSVPKDEKPPHALRINGFDIICLQCGKSHVSKAKHGKFCSEACRIDYHKREGGQKQ